MQTADRPVLRSRGWLVAGATLAALLLVISTVGVDQPVLATAAAAVAVVVAVLVLAWAALHERRQRREYENELTAWAAERAVQSERLRIARDLHDLASHGLGLITLRAAAARRTHGPDADAERGAALADIERAGRDATTELRRMLTVLREPGSDAPLRPAETMADLPAIVAAASRVGVVATLDAVPDAPVSASSSPSAPSSANAWPTPPGTPVRSRPGSRFGVKATRSWSASRTTAPRRAGAPTRVPAADWRACVSGSPRWAAPSPSTAGDQVSGSRRGYPTGRRHDHAGEGADRR